METYEDSNIKDDVTAIIVAQGKVNQFSNPLIEANFTTDKTGLRAGQVITVEDTNRGINETLVVQTVSCRVQGGKYKDYCVYNVKAATYLFGWIELFQKLLTTTGDAEINSNSIVETYIEAKDDMSLSESNTVSKSGIKQASESEEIDMSETNNVSKVAQGSWHC